MKTRIASAIILACTVGIGLTACETSDAVARMDRQPIGIDGQDQVCASSFADRIDVPMSSVRVNSHDTSPSGNTVVFLQTDEHRASCEVDDYGNLISLDVLR